MPEPPKNKKKKKEKPPEIPPEFTDLKSLQDRVKISHNNKIKEVDAFSKDIVKIGLPQDYATKAKEQIIRMTKEFKFRKAEDERIEEEKKKKAGKKPAK